MANSQEIAWAFENLSNTCRWIHVDHYDDRQHVTVMTYDGRLLTASNAFAFVALVEIAELSLGRGAP